MPTLSTDAPAGPRAPHGGPASAAHDDDVPEDDLLTPLTLRSIRLRNRIVMSPMCQYSAEEGLANDWHLVHLGSRAVGGAALVFVEASAVERVGRISPGDVGIWSDEHIEPLARIARFLKDQGAIAGIQLAHAGRKGSSARPWEGGTMLTAEEGGWPVVAPSPIGFSATDPPPVALDPAGIERVQRAFEDATRRALAAGFEVIEIHGAHGYLLHEFLSPLSNYRDDEYGGNLKNRMRFVLEVAERVRAVVPAQLPVFLRLSATDWVDGGWDVEQSVVLATRLKALGIDLVDVSSGGTVPRSRIPMESGYQLPFARRIRDEADIMTGAVGLISDAHRADEIITAGDADLVFLGRELLREPYWPLKAEHVLEEEPAWPKQYAYAVKRRKG